MQNLEEETQKRISRENGVTAGLRDKWDLTGEVEAEGKIFQTARTGCKGPEANHITGPNLWACNLSMGPHAQKPTSPHLI